MLRVMLDSNYWVSLKYEPETRVRFEEFVANDEIEVIFSYGNFIDLVRADEQNELSEIIADAVDIFIPAMDYEGDDYAYTEDPIGLIPDEEIAQRVRIETYGSSEADTLRTIFRVGDWNMDSDWYAEFTEYMKKVSDEYGFEYAMALAFEDYLEEGEEAYRLWEHKIETTEYVRKMASLYRIAAVKDNEKIDSHDLADIEICSQAIVTKCDMLLIESKWRNLGLVKKVTDNLEGEEDVEVFDDFDEFLDVMEVYLTGVA